MKATCEHIQEKVLDNPGRPLQPRERYHLERCSNCSEFMEIAQSTGCDLQEIGRTVCGAESAELSASLREKTKERLLDRLQTEAPESESYSTPKVVPIKTEAPRGKPPFAWHKAGWAVAALLLIGAIGLIVQRIYLDRPIGRLEFASGPVELGNSQASVPYEGLGEWEYRRSDTIETANGGAGIFSLGNDIVGVLAESTSLKIDNPRRVALEQGAAWFSVDKGGKGLEVFTDRAVARVTGTSFGVSSKSGSTTVEVIEGSVRVSADNRQYQLNSGQMIELKPDSKSTVQARPGGDELAGWVQHILDQRDAVYRGQFMPSLMQEK